MDAQSLKYCRGKLSESENRRFEYYYPSPNNNIENKEKRPEEMDLLFSAEMVCNFEI